MAASLTEPPKASNYASVAANLANNNQKVIDPQPPRHEKYIPHFRGPTRSKSLKTQRAEPLSNAASLASSKAALLAHQGQATSSSKAGTNKSQVILEVRAAATAARSSDMPHTARPRRPASSDGPNAAQSNHGLGNRAAAAATKSWNNTASVPARANTIYGSREERAAPAVSKAWGAHKASAHRPVVAPLNEREAAMIQRRIEARQQESSERRDRQPIIRIRPEFLGEHPPVRLEREEKAHAADLHEQAVLLAKQAYAKQQQNQSSPAHLSKTAQQLANEKLARMSRTDVDDLDTMRSYYGTPAPVQRSKSQRLLKRSQSQRSRSRGRDDAAQSERIRSQMNALRSQIDQIDANTQEQDRKKLLEAARKKVQNDMLRMDESVYKDTGKMSKAMMDDWDTKTRERTKGSRQQALFQGLQPEKAVNIGGDRLIDHTEVDKLAVSRVKPTLAGIDEAVQKRRDMDEQKREEKEERQRERQKEKEEKADAKREKAEEKRKLKEQKAAEKAEKAEHSDGQNKRASLVGKLPSVPAFGRHKRSESSQTAEHTDHTEGTTDDDADVASGDSPATDKKKSPLRLPAFTKFSRHRRNVSDEPIADEPASSIEEHNGDKRASRKLPLLGKLNRKGQRAAANETVEDERSQARPQSPTPASQSLKSRFSKIIHRKQATDSTGLQPNGRSFEHANGSVSTDLHEGETASITDDEMRPTISAPIPLEGFTPAERTISADDRDDALFGKHLPSKFHENM